MDNLYTKKILKKFEKEQLLEISIKNEIAVPEGTTNPQIIDLILGKGCVMSDEHAAEYGRDGLTINENPQPAFVDDPVAEKFTKAEILKSHWYSHKRDFLNGVLEDDKTYSYAAVEWLIKNAK